MGNKKDLRQHGYLTSDEFVDMVAPALKSYLKQNWGKYDTEALYHPEDLFSNASLYFDVALNVVGQFGIQGKRE
jgi:hypothetical protein